MVWPGERKAKENNDNNERSNVKEGLDTFICLLTCDELRFHLA